MKRAFLQPAQGGLVRHPGSRRPLEAEGEEVELTSYWRRRLRRGDVVQIGEARVVAPAVKPAPPKKSKG